MTLPKISIIIPIYNVGNYIERALHSAVSQTYKNLEIIIINDGSTDNSSQICDEFARRDKRIEIYHQNNSGVSNARNKGLSVATGKYIRFFDSDDELVLDSTEKYLEAIEKEKCDIVFGGYEKRDCKADMLRLEIPKNCETLTGKQIVSKYYYGKNAVAMLLSVPWACLIKREFLLRNKISFDEKFHPAEDALFIANCIKFADKITILNCVSYIYYDYKNSEQMTAMSYARPDAYIVSLLHLEIILQIAKNENERIFIQHKFFDQFVKSLLVLFVYRKYLIKKSAFKRLCEIAQNEYAAEIAGKFSVGCAYHKKWLPCTFFVAFLLKNNMLKCLYAFLLICSFFYGLVTRESKLAKSVYRKKEFGEL